MLMLTFLSKLYLTMSISSGKLAKFGEKPDFLHMNVFICTDDIFVEEKDFTVMVYWPVGEQVMSNL